ncbi:hypothetical protein HU200_012165 [Digitaria exilis]|uniref:Uncharacterized protein n=1 Tax=Digitaria exilis TaxID=1010633 RepID=A0A835FGG9_9POAL|nr:hypothetical protein HU200_012165 [Digitaria exilis]
MQRRNRISDVSSTNLLGAPITPPILASLSKIPEEMYTFHMVKLVVSDNESVLLLFRENDIYFIAFNPSGGPGFLRAFLELDR